MADEIDLAQEREHIATNSAVNDVREQAATPPGAGSRFRSGMILTRPSASGPSWSAARRQRKPA